MDNGIYIALSRQMGLFRDMEMTANNIANADTVGYNAEKMMFEDFLVKGGSDMPKMAFSRDAASYRDTRDGAMKTTGNPLDVAISGPGYFMVQTPLGERYTRAGNFQLDTDGVLVTPEGYPVLDQAGQAIIFEAEDQDIRIGELGNITVDGEERGNIGVMEFANPQLLERTGGGLFKSDAPGIEAAESRVLHGVLESSNVQPIMELTRMMQLTKSVASTSKFIEMSYDLERKASNAFAKQGN